MRALAAALALTACGCALPRAEARIRASGDLARYKRVGVLPFADKLGLGRKYAVELGKALWKLEYDPVDVDQLEVVFKRLDMDYSGGLSLQDLAEIRRLTFVDALVFGTVDTAAGAKGGGDDKVRGVTMMMIDATTGDVVLDASFRPRGSFKTRDVAGIVAEMTAAVGKEIRMTQAGLRPDSEAAP